MVLSGAGKGIFVTVVALVVAAIVFVLVRVANSLNHGGKFDFVVKRIGLLDSTEARLAVQFENASKFDKEIRDLTLCYLSQGSLAKIAGMAYAPLARGLDPNFISHDAGGYGFLIEAGKNQSAIVDYLLPASFQLPPNARLGLCWRDERGRLLFAPISLRESESQLLKKRRIKKAKGFSDSASL